MISFFPMMKMKKRRDTIPTRKLSGLRIKQRRTCPMSSVARQLPETFMEPMPTYLSKAAYSGTKDTLPLFRLAMSSSDSDCLPLLPAHLPPIECCLHNSFNHHDIINQLITRATSESIPKLMSS